ncbi:histidinol-phosphate transaminase [Tichowtungia aerotolerans]|uniref:Histidinol-phosphate aminotransferase n=1 Tax=Tichowtungia aerotolerans TaxID=2697043 RepID=A0A6P1M514_9BACT|nr:histidinol-phosphate transaminase [Tichowtungia aerotolerans]QHI68941.1 histidinol-phosphate transaminase [Tichowtungia aerotolerans]
MKNLIRKSVQALDGYVPGEQPQGSDVVKLNTNENPWLCSVEVHDILREIDMAALAKYPDPVCTEVRKVIAENLSVGIGNIFAGNGSDEVLALCIRAFVERDGGSVGFFDPSYSLYPVLANIEDVETRPVALDENFGWQMPDGYESSVFFLTNPNAPTSLLFPKEKVEEFVCSFPGVVVIDEAYVDFASETCMDLATQYKNVLVCRTLSKSYALAGIRFGYCVGDKELIDALYKIKDSYNVNTLTQEVARVALLDHGTMEAITTAVKNSRKLMTEELQALGFDVLPSETNFLWVKPPKPGAKKIFEELKKRNVYIRWFEGDRTGDYLRITVGSDAQTMLLVEALEDILGKGKSDG